MPQKRNKSYGAIESPAQPGQSYGGGHHSNQQLHPSRNSNNNNNVSYLYTWFVYYVMCECVSYHNNESEFVSHYLLKTFQDITVCIMEEAPLLVSPDREEASPLLGQAHNNESGRG